ncbi:energy transducer TonB [Agarilytica rhodophyticola]|uniref:energy transducer TonB n=1 Tax=Agarilytica rhodophyticola TaxID=1737490 RepID=UPI000B343CC4|nr:energy transducer TonB [Agarilytica rhodophyticola]
MSTATADIGSGDRLSFTIFIAAACHALIIFGITFSLDTGTKVAPTLNITLATHASKIPPKKADFLAQHDQQASGTSSEVKELTVKDQAQLNDVKIRDINPAPSQKATQKKEVETQIITTQNRSNQKISLQEKLDQKNESSEERIGENLDAPLIDPEFASLQAKLDRLKQDLARQPRIRRLTSVSTKASYDARYLNDWAQKVELVGNKNFPEAALREEIFGSLRMSVMILPNGTVENIEILQSSGHTILDEAATQIVKLASPFQPFPREIKQSTDKLEIIRTWRFEITGLKTTQ